VQSFFEEQQWTGGKCEEGKIVALGRSSDGSGPIDLPGVMDSMIGGAEPGGIEIDGSEQ
jgi:hypothetical protein